MTIKITGKKMLALLDEQVVKKGGYHCPGDGPSGCNYMTDEGDPSCIIGYILHQLAVENGVEGDFRRFFDDGLRSSLSVNNT